jgi:hypothetical protein
MKHKQKVSPANIIQKEQYRFLVVVVIIVGSLYLVTQAINPVVRISQQQQYVFAQKNTPLPSYNSTDIDNNPKHQFYTSSEPANQTKAIDTLAANGEQAIDAITEVINPSDMYDQVRDYGQEAIEVLRDKVS